MAQQVKLLASKSNNLSSTPPRKLSSSLHTCTECSLSGLSEGIKGPVIWEEGRRRGAVDVGECHGKAVWGTVNRSVKKGLSRRPKE